MEPGNRAIALLKDKLDSHGALDAEDRAAIDRIPVVTRNYEPGQYLLREGDRPKTCGLLMSGFVYRHKIVGDGGRQIVSIHISPDLLDVQQLLLAEADHNVQALTLASVLVMQIDDVIAVAIERPAVALALWRQSLVDASIVREWVANIGRRDARARTAHLLCELAVRHDVAGLGDRRVFELPMTQEQLGDALGLTAVHINRTLKTLETDGVITRSKRSVTVADWNRLRTIGDFSSTYLHPREVIAAHRN